MTNVYNDYYNNGHVTLAEIERNYKVPRNFYQNLSSDVPASVEKLFHPWNRRNYIYQSQMERAMEDTVKYVVKRDPKFKSAAATIVAHRRGQLARRRYVNMLNEYYRPGGRGAQMAIARLEARTRS